MSRKPDAAPGVLTRDSTVMWDEAEGFLWLLLAMDLRLKKDKWGRGGGTNWTREWGGEQVLWWPAPITVYYLMGQWARMTRSRKYNT